MNELEHLKGKLKRLSIVEVKSREEEAYQQELIEVLKKRQEKCLDLKLEIEKYIADIDDSRTRQIFEYRYIYRWTWQRISKKMGSNDASYSRKVHDRYLKNH